MVPELYFSQFLKEIRPTDAQRDDYKTGHRVLRNRLSKDEQLAPIIVSTFLQGSYRRATAVRPQGDHQPDVDVIVVTKLSKEEYSNPEDAMNVFVPFLDKHYAGKYKMKGRAIGIELSYVELDLVITSAPSESEVGIFKSDSVTTEDTPEDVQDWRLVSSWVSSEKRSTYKVSKMLEAAKAEKEWQLSPLYIPDREAKEWEQTHPLAQIKWTWDKNSKCDGHYVNVVKAVKWWRLLRHPTPEHPKGYPVEHIIGQNCSDGIESVAEGVTKTLENIASNSDYELHTLMKTVPFLPDHGVPQHNVLKRLSAEEFTAFYNRVLAE